METTKLTPIRLPVDLLADLDTLVGKRQKSRFIIEATRKELLRLKQKRALQAAAGAFRAEEYPEFGTAADVAAWVRNLREETERRRRGIFGD